MATMIPGRVDATTPASERRIYDLLRCDPDTKDCIVLHSLGLAKRGSKPYGEIDFVVLIPGAGIVCLEVKGGRVRCEDGIWYTRNRDDEEAALAKSPVMQARDGMFAVGKAIRAHFGHNSVESAVILASAVVLTDVPSPPEYIEAESWEFIDRDSLTSRPIGRTLRSVLRKQRERFGQADSPGTDREVLKAIRAFLRPDFDLVIARRTLIDRAEEHIIRLTENQFDVLDDLEVNRRCVVDGAAGTGKTLLAVELARRARAIGRRPIVLCFNRLLGRWMERELSGVAGVVGSYHRVLRSLITETSLRESFLADLATSDQAQFADWPTYAIEALWEKGTIGDLLIVDEAQDLVTEADVCALDAMVEGGLAGGRWVMFGDFTRQAIFGGPCAEKGFEGFEQTVRERSPYFTTLRLRTNCRNTRQIAEETAMLAGFESMPYRSGAAEGPAVDFRFWRDPEDQTAELLRCIKELLHEGLRPEQITILSPLRLEHSAAKALEGKIPEITDLGTVSKAPVSAALRFATIQSFKGLETPVAVLTDLRGIQESDRQALLYVAMSRARTHLVLLAHESFRPHMETAIRRRMRGIG